MFCLQCVSGDASSSFDIIFYFIFFITLWPPSVIGKKKPVRFFINKNSPVHSAELNSSALHSRCILFCSSISTLLIGFVLYK
jgi:hypothetical protein